MPHQCTNCGRTFPDGSKKMLSGCPDCGGNKFQFAPSAAATGTASEQDGESEQSTPSNASSTAGSETDSSGVASRAAEAVRGWVSSNSTDESLESSPESTGTATGSPDAEEWPTAESRSVTESAAGSSEFTEWPDSARRPEQRSTDPDQSEMVEQSDDDTESADADEPLETDTTVPPADRNEDSAQASARSEMVPADDLPADDETDVITDVGGTDPNAEQSTDHPPDHGRVVSEPTGEQPSIEDLRAELNEQFESIKIVRPGQYELNLMELYNRDEYIISLQEDGRYVIDVPDSWRDDE